MGEQRRPSTVRVRLGRGSGFVAQVPGRETVRSPHLFTALVRALGWHGTSSEELEARIRSGELVVQGVGR